MKRSLPKKTSSHLTKLRSWRRKLTSRSPEAKGWMFISTHFKGWNEYWNQRKPKVLRFRPFDLKWDVQNPKLKPWKEVVQVALVPVLTVGVTVGLWSVIPKPQIPAAFRSLSEPLEKVGKMAGSTASTGNTTNTTTSNAEPGVKSFVPPSSIFFGGGTSGKPSVSSASVAPAPTAADATSRAGSANVARIDSPKTLVSLGDSITYGFGLPGSRPGHPSSDAYPFLVGRAEGMNVEDLGVTSWSSADLLHALHTPKFKTALQHANLVTIDIGSNDLLHASYNLLQPNATLPPKNAILDDVTFQHAIAGYVERMPEIIQTVRDQTSAPIVLINLYDPFPDGSALHNVAEQLITAANNDIWRIAAVAGIPVVDAHNLINHHQTSDIRLNELDIHPTVRGQKALARLIEQAIATPEKYIPVFYAVSDSGTLVYDKPGAGANAIGWIRGNVGVRVVGYPNLANQAGSTTSDGRTGNSAASNTAGGNSVGSNSASGNGAGSNPGNNSASNSAGGNGAGNNVGDTGVGNTSVGNTADTTAANSSAGNADNSNANGKSGAQGGNGSTGPQGALAPSGTNLKTGELEVQLPNGENGYVAAKNVTLLARPWPNEVDFGTRQAAVQTGSISIYQQGMSATSGEGFIWRNTVYLPIDVIAKAAGGTLKQHAQRRIVSLMTPLHSGLIYGGWALASGAHGGHSSGSPTIQTSSGSSPTTTTTQSVVFTPEGMQQLHLIESAWLLRIDGEATSLADPIVSANNTLYVPAAEVWQALGGKVKRGTGGLLTLSVTGS